MIRFDQVRAAVNATIEEDKRDVCLRLVDEIERHKLDDSLWTYSVFSRWMRRDPKKVVEDCVNFLASAKKARLLQVHFLAFNPQDPDDIGAHVDDSEVRNAFQSGVLYHPESGRKVENFQDWLVPYFTLGAKSVARFRDE